MGITIHYRGKLNNTNLIEPLIDELEDIAKDMNWKYSLLNDDLNKPKTAVFEDGEIKGDLALKGISLRIHKDSETLSFYFDKEGNLRDLFSTVVLDKEELEKSFCSIKTQFAPIQVHITIVKLLKYIKTRYVQNLEVIDEGEYWRTNNEDTLKAKLNFIDKKINELAEEINEIEFSENDTLEEMLQKIEKLFKRKLK